MSPSLRRAGLFVIASVVLASSILGAARASSIIELIGGDPFILPGEQQSMVIFSVNLRHELPSPIPISEASRITLQFAESENPRPIDRVFFSYDFFHGDIVTRGPNAFTLSSEGRDRTGVEQFVITKQSAGWYGLRLMDTGSAIPHADYSKLCITITIGADTGSTCVRMISAGTVWQIN